MAKIADRYYKQNPWCIVEQGFSPDYTMVSESIFSLGNEHMGVRGYFDEGYGGKSLIGSYISGVYEEQPAMQSSYRGMVDTTYFIANTVDWLYTRITLDGERLDLAHSRFSDFTRWLDLRTGVLTRQFVWHTQSDKRLRLCFERFVSMDSPLFGGQRITVTPLDFDGVLEMICGLDFSKDHIAAGENLWDVTNSSVNEAGLCTMLARTHRSHKQVFAACRLSGDFTGCTPCAACEKRAVASLTVALKRGEDSTVTRVYESVVVKQSNVEEECSRAQSALVHADYDSLHSASAAWWKTVWQRSDIKIEGDDLNQQGIRFCIFQMHQTYHGAEPSSVIGAKGLTGEVYNGNTFWDTETYCLPFYIFNNPQAAKSLLMFRYTTLDKARARAKQLDCDGAFYPIATIGGEECCTLWQHSNLQLQASTAVAYGIWHYVHVVGDTDFLYAYGAEMLVEISRMLASRCDCDPRTGRYGYYGVMGPDEFQMMVNHNCYTNFVGRETLRYTLDTLAAMRKDASGAYTALMLKLGLSEYEGERWNEIAGKMYIPYDEDTALFEQHEGYFGLPHIDVDKIPTEQFPLYHHWSYDRIYRNDMIKQPDVLMLMLLYNARFTREQKLANYEFYEPRCIHESSLSPSVHSILACELGRYDDALRFFGFATRMDIDNYNRNSGEGLHTTSIAAAWMNIVYGFAGMRSDGELLSFAPILPAKWSAYSFTLVAGEGELAITVKPDAVSFTLSGAERLEIAVYGQRYWVGKQGVDVSLKSIE